MIGYRDVSLFPTLALYLYTRTFIGYVYWNGSKINYDGLGYVDGSNMACGFDYTVGEPS